MRKQRSYLQGVLDCERMYNKGVGFDNLMHFVKTEGEIGGWKWVVWSEGFIDAIEHFERLEKEGLV